MDRMGLCGIEMIGVSRYLVDLIREGCGLDASVSRAGGPRRIRCLVRAWSCRTLALRRVKERGFVRVVRMLPFLGSVEGTEGLEKD